MALRFGSDLFPFSFCSSGYGYSVTANHLLAMRLVVIFVNQISRHLTSAEFQVTIPVMRHTSP